MFVGYVVFDFEVVAVVLVVVEVSVCVVNDDGLLC